MEVLQANGQGVVRLVPGAGTAHVYRSHPEHYVRKHSGYGIQARILEDLKRSGVVRVRVHARRENGAVVHYKTRLGDWLANGVRETLSQEHGEQVFLGVEAMGSPVVVKGAEDESQARLWDGFEDG